ncbi:MAG: ester cyclase [Actinomycetota bacterium]
MSEANKAVVRRWVEDVQSDHRFEVMEEIFAPDIVNHDRPGGLPSPQGIEGIREFFKGIVAAFPDFKAVIEDQIAEGDKVVTRKTISGTNQGEFMGIPPTGKRMEVPVIDVFRVVDGKCTDHWSVVDQMGMMQQLGLMPGQGES